ncbi:MAG: DUF3267 domain-containing protein [Lachnospiraceae bacterium]|nr:DUF3267 domain-containing protein [Lachnospiraceae bacterium]
MGRGFDKEKARKLSPAEERRLKKFEEVCADMETMGYRKVELTIGIVWANVVAIFLAIPIVVIGVGLFAVNNPGVIPIIGNTRDFLIFFISILVLVVIHELIHGFTWSFFAENGMKDIELGFMKQYLTPYATCCTPLKKAGYIMGAAMPMIILGIIPLIIAIAIGSALILSIGLIMTIAAGGDIMIIFKLLTYRSDAGEKLIYDHPTQAGCCIFEK